jgi:hypothetical protein
LEKVVGLVEEVEEPKGTRLLGIVIAVPAERQIHLGAIYPRALPLYPPGVDQMSGKLPMPHQVVERALSKALVAVIATQGVILVKGMANGSKADMGNRVMITHSPDKTDMLRITKVFTTSNSLTPQRSTLPLTSLVSNVISYAQHHIRFTGRKLMIGIFTPLYISC